MPNSTAYKRKPSINHSDLLDNVRAFLNEPIRAVLVAHDGNGRFSIQAVEHGESVLNIKRDLSSHIREQPYPDEWLAQIKNDIDARLLLRGKARRDRRLIVYGPSGPSVVPLPE